MGSGQLLQRAREKRCPACDGQGGRHTRLDCSYLRDELERKAAQDRRAKPRRKEGSDAC